MIEQLKKDEGFRGNPYKCSENKLTVGYGTTFPLTEEEAEMLLKHRLKNEVTTLVHKHTFIGTLPQIAQDVLHNMAYQMGANGVSKFKKMIVALKKGDFKTASKEMLDSKWKRQTPKRAKRLANEMREV